MISSTEKIVFSCVDKKAGAVVKWTQEKCVRKKPVSGNKVGLVAEPTLLMLVVWSAKRQLATACLPAANAQ